MPKVAARPAARGDLYSASQPQNKRVISDQWRQDDGDHSKERLVRIEMSHEPLISN